MAQKHPSFVDKDGKVFERIRFGDEIYFLKSIGAIAENSTNSDGLYSWNYCDDCFAKQGEFHLVKCDLEICPICFGQALSCECKLEWDNISK